MATLGYAIFEEAATLELVNGIGKMSLVLHQKQWLIERVCRTKDVLNNRQSLYNVKYIIYSTVVSGLTPLI